MISLRPYQLAAIADARRRVAGGERRVMICAPTGAGKTTIAAAIITGVVAKGRRALVVAHRRELIRQPYERFVEAGIEHAQLGVVMAGLRASTRCAPEGSPWREALARPDAPIQIAAIESLRRREHPPADVIVIDEAHRTLAPGYRALLAEYPEAAVLGLSATPERADGKGLGEVYQALVVVSTYAELVAEGYLVAPRVYSTRALPDLTGVRTRAGEYDAEQLAAACDRPHLIGDVVEHWQRHGGGAPTLVFAVGVAHSQHLAAAFVGAGVVARHVDGSTPADEREAAWRGLTDGSIAVVCNCDVASEGLDLPAVKCVISARPTQSLRVWLQQTGRGSRPWPQGGHAFMVLDHAGNAVRHGLPQDDREWSLEPKPKRGKGEAKKPRRQAWTCEVDGCGTVNPLDAMTCETCGADRPTPVTCEIVELAGDLVELSTLRPLTLDERHVAWLHVLEEWRGHNSGARMPRKPGWCWHRYRERYHCDPPRGGERAEWTEDDAARHARGTELLQTVRDRGWSDAAAFARMR